MLKRHAITYNTHALEVNVSIILMFCKHQNCQKKPKSLLQWEMASNVKLILDPLVI